MMRNDPYLRCGYYDEWGSEPYHNIYHYVPNPDILLSPTIAEATPYAMRLLAQNLYLDSAERKEEIINSLKYAGGAVTFRDAFFKVGVHEKLSSGCSFTAQRLNGNDTTQTRMFECEKTKLADRCDWYLYEDFSASMLSRGPYYVSSANNFTWFDSYYYLNSSSTEDCPLLLFENILDEIPSVDGEELAKALERLGLLELVITDPKRVVLVFVVPENHVSNIDSQTINMEPTSDKDGVGMLKQIGRKREKDLNDAGLFTIGDLRTRLKNEGDNAGESFV